VAKRGHHSVYVVYLRNPKGDGKAGSYARAKEMEVMLGDSLRKRGYVVFGGH
jgi:hypothetical protein